MACESSGVVRDAFRQRGHDAVSCDLLPTESPGPHIQGDVLDYLRGGWDLMVAHPPCQFLSNSGVRWLYTRPGRLGDMVRAAGFFRTLYLAPIPQVCIENPVQHKYAKWEHGCGDQKQVIQPWQFGHGETKATCLWLRGLDKLRHTDIVQGRQPRIHHMPPSKDRSKLRSITYQGIADAMADQWG